MAEDWSAQLGKRRRARDAAAAQVARSEHEDTAHTAAMALERWPGIVNAIRHVVAAYNAGANDEVLTVAEERAVPGRPAVRIASRGVEGPFLTAGLEGTFITVSTRDGDGVSHQTERRLRPDRDDDRTAAYLLQNWMEHL
jgi:hypothetical protein